MPTELTEAHKQKIDEAIFFAEFKNSPQGAALGRILAGYTERALHDFVHYRGGDRDELWTLRARWLARAGFQSELLAVMETKIEQLDEVAEELGHDPDELALRSMIDGPEEES